MATPWRERPAGDKARRPRGVYTEPGLPYGFEVLKLNCGSERPLYSYRLFEPGAPENSVVVPMGTTVELPLVNSAEVWRFRNLQSGNGFGGSYPEDVPYSYWLHQASP